MIPPTSKVWVHGTRIWPHRIGAFIPNRSGIVGVGRQKTRIATGEITIGGHLTDLACALYQHIGGGIR